MDAVTSRCSAYGTAGRCELETWHDGPHRKGEVSWPRPMGKKLGKPPTANEPAPNPGVVS
jgi:hypothetical protein